MVVEVVVLVEQLYIRVGDDRTVCLKQCSRAIRFAPVVIAKRTTVPLVAQLVVVQHREHLVEVPCRTTCKDVA